MITVAICDDNRTHLTKAERMVKDILNRQSLPFSTKTYNSSEDLLNELKSRTFSADIVVMDIELDENNGIDLAKEINMKSPDTKIIFLSSHTDYISQSYEVNHVWYVTKDKVSQYLEPALTKAMESLNDNNNCQKSIIVRHQGTSVLIPLNTICYITRVGRKAMVKCMEGEYYDSRKPADLISDNLKSSFIRCHQGYWINIDKIAELDHNEFVLKTGERIPISRTYKDESRKQFLSSYKIIR